MRTYLYVDGFNLYYQIRSKGLKWLNPRALAHELLPAHCSVERIKYFTARVSGARDPDAPRRQQIFLKALQSLPEVEIHFGEFLTKNTWRPIVNLPVGDCTIDCAPSATLPRGIHAVPSESQSLEVWNYPVPGKGKRKRRHPQSNAIKAEVFDMEEKGSDVNLGVHLLNDAWKGDFDIAVVISNDTDLITPIRMVSDERGLPVTVATAHRHGCSPKLKAVADHTRHIHDGMLKRAQFPDPIPGTTICKPTEW